MAKNEILELSESQIRNIVKASIRESLLRKRAMQRERCINKAVSSVIKEMIEGGEPEQVADGVYITDIQFGPDADGTVSLSFDATEENPDGDAFQTEFTLDQYRLDAMMHSEHPGDNLYMGYPEHEEQLATCVRLYQGVSYDPAVAQAIKIAIIKHYLEQQSPMNEDTKRQRKKDPMNQWFKDMNDAQKVRDTMEYIDKGGRNPNKRGQ